jgi:hypothetical protein
MKNIQSIFLICISFYTARIFAQEFLYPVAIDDTGEETLVYLLYQHSASHLELWLWNPTTKKAHKALLSSFTPAGLRILPDCSGFSFIDNGRIKIKKFAKRSPKSIDFYEPIYDIGVVEWINSNQCYFSAKESNRSKIYHANIRGEITQIIGSQTYDYLYPQKVNDQLFYIERSYCNEGCRYAIMQSTYPYIPYDEGNSFNSIENFEIRAQDFIKHQENMDRKNNNELHYEKRMIADFGDQALAFLHMRSEIEGFVLEHPNKIDKQDKTVVLSVYHLEKKINTWHKAYLFSFAVPLHLLLPESSSRLYESMLPLLPRCYDSEIYFVDCAQNKENYNLNVYVYHLVDGTIKAYSHAQELDRMCMAPLKINGIMCCGGSIDPYNSESAPCLRVDDKGSMSAELIVLK